MADFIKPSHEILVDTHKNADRYREILKQYEVTMTHDNRDTWVDSTGERIVSCYNNRYTARFLDAKVMRIISAGYVDFNTREITIEFNMPQDTKFSLKYKIDKDNITTDKYSDYIILNNYEFMCEHEYSSRPRYMALDEARYIADIMLEEVKYIYNNLEYSFYMWQQEVFNEYTHTSTKYGSNVYVGDTISTVKELEEYYRDHQNRPHVFAIDGYTPIYYNELRDCIMDDMGTSVSDYYSKDRVFERIE